MSTPSTTTPPSTLGRVALPFEQPEQVVQVGQPAFEQPGQVVQVGQPAFEQPALAVGQQLEASIDSTQPIELKTALSKLKENLKKENLNDSMSLAKGDENHSVNESNIAAHMPKLRRPFYYTNPTIEELAAKEQADPGYCSRVKDFVIGCHGSGSSVKFLGKTDLRWVDLDDVITFQPGTVFVNGVKTPPGLQFSGTAEITFVLQKSFTMKEMFRDDHEARVIKSVKREIEDQGYEFVSYDPVSEECKYRIKYFSGFGYIGFEVKVNVGLATRIKKLMRKIKKNLDR